jgi:hypothetical protein
MDDAEVVGMLEPREHLLGGSDHGLRCPRLSELGLELAAREQLHHQVCGPGLGRAEIRDAHAVGVVEPRRAGGLAFEPLANRRIAAELRMQDLDRHVALESDVVAFEDRPHPSRSEQ